MSVKSFGAFLDHVQTKSLEALQSPQPPGPAETRPIQLLEYLPAGRESIALPDLLKKSKMSYVEFTKALGLLVENGLVQVSGGPGEEEVTATDLGRQLKALSGAGG